MRLQYGFWAVCLLSLASPARADVNVAERAAHALDTVIRDRRWLNFPSSNTRHQVLTEPGAKLNERFESLLNRAGLSASRFQLRISPIHNVVCDTERKLILADPTFIESFRKLSKRPDYALTVVFAHEVAHYILRAYQTLKGEEAFGSKPFVISNQIIPSDDDEHAQVEAIAAEILRRAGRGTSRIRIAYASFFEWFHAFDRAFRADGRMDPSTDLVTREFIIKAYLQGRSK